MSNRYHPTQDHAWKDRLEDWEKEIIIDAKNTALCLNLPFTESTQIVVYNAMCKAASHIKKQQFIENAPKNCGEGVKH